MSSVRLAAKYRVLGVYHPHSSRYSSSNGYTRGFVAGHWIASPTSRTAELNVKPGEPVIEHVPVSVSAAEVVLEGDLSMPSTLRGVVLFAHGSGSSRHSPRNRYVAEVLNEHSLGTLLVDLLTTEEEREDQFTGHLRFNIDLLTRR